MRRSASRFLQGLCLGVVFILAACGCGLAGRPAGAQVAGSGAPAGTSDCVSATESARLCSPGSSTGIETGRGTQSPELDVSLAGPPAAPVTPGPDVTGAPVETGTAAPSHTAVSTREPPTSTQAATPCPPDLCAYTDQLMLLRPISPPGRDSIDVSYRFGTDQGGERDPHHGVEFLNPSGTPVLAAAEGRVVVAGDDRQVFYGPYSYFYGNLVVLEHRLPGLSQPLFTLYGHLSELSVAEGDIVQAGQEVGLVGMTGVATGSHLHFEVRFGENTYQNSSNPELWLAPLQDEDGRPMGALAGRILDESEDPLQVENIVLEHLVSPDGPSDFSLYLKSYVEKSLLGQPPFGESFAAGDLPAGWYRISFVQNGMQSRVVEVMPGQLTVVTFRVGEWGG